MILFMHTFNKSFRIFTLAFAASLIVTACKVSDPHDHNEQESFTTVELSYVNNTDATDKQTAVIKFKDGFGHGGNALAKNDSIVLKSGASYTVELVLLDETKNPAEIMSEEVLEEAEAHQIFYMPSGAALTVNYLDKDKNNRPLGLLTTQTAGAAGMGTLKVTLKHQQEGETLLKNDTSNVGVGSTDVEVTFKVIIK